ncbi:testis-expressed protein 9 [Coccinella septempunctata]|uniref:testis-expressed protein 9 n=1 Tax=Coccinella septempunctata TaxID=41139 RepID=UPI001D07B825|nr:testis-expressed protein 9 [Coccinella septempunctata]
MEWDILKKEQEYLRENEIIESKTKALLRKVDDAMKMQENLLKDSSVKLDICNSTVPQQAKKVEDQNISKIALNDPTVPNEEILNDMGQKGTHHFYRAKIKALKEENEKMQADMKMMNSESKQLQKDLNQCSEDKDKWFLQYNLGKSQISKLENQLSQLNMKLQSKDAENIAMKKEIDILKREIKVTTQSTNTNELKLNKALEENEKNKALLKTLKKSEKDLREGHKKQVQELTSMIQQIEKQKNELIHGFKKQLQLIDNLKKQKTHLETFNLVQIAEAEFMKILDWRTEN